MIDISKLTGIVICYMEREEMEKVYSHLKELKILDVAVKKSFNPEDVPYPWTIALIVLDNAKMQWLDDYLTDNNTDLGREKELYAGNLRIMDFLRMLPLDGKYEPGIVRIKTGTCPMKGSSGLPISCMFCPVGHLLECHYPYTCEIARCSHWEREILELE